ncbi:Ubiquitin-60S ribosomal protein L40 [Actinomortierella ambigua]|uniref:Ubiquitin-60S ribosomal protein L40 n=1 Tax=Actinomortierella ambigua TaxID=1343610 RepID=A0A9P6QAG4_9FUNG|nr:Ubiquitin-60S ribosomal protein L40 [Actinomortierella ambigua]
MDEGSLAFAARLIATLPSDELSEIQERQANMTNAIDKSTRSLTALNEFSAVKWTELSQRFDTHVKTIRTLQSDLDQVFRKIRTIKQQLGITNVDPNSEDEENA